MLVLLEHLVAHGEPVIRVDGAFLRDQVPDVSIRCKDFVILAEILLDRLRLGGRFDYDEIVCHCLREPAPENKKPRTCRGPGGQRMHRQVNAACWDGHRIPDPPNAQTPAPARVGSTAPSTPPTSTVPCPARRHRAPASDQSQSRAAGATKCRAAPGSRGSHGIRWTTAPARHRNKSAMRRRPWVRSP